MVDHGADEVVEAVVVFGLTGFVERRLRIGIAAQLRLEAGAVVVEAGELLVSGSGIGFECAEQFGCLLGGSAEELQMRQFGASWRIVLVVARIRPHVAFRLTDVGDESVGVADVFPALDKLVIAVECASYILDGDIE